MADVRTPVSTAVYDALRADILGGRLAVGDGIPSERTLSERHAVNRHAVREAVKRLQQAGLVQVSQGGATRVLDWSRTGGLELLTDLPGAGDIGAVRAGYELRACLAAEIAVRSAQRADDDARDHLRARAAGLIAARQAGDDATLLKAYRELWDVLVDASRNIAYRLAYNSLLAGEDTLRAAAIVFLRDELHDAGTTEALIGAVLDGDQDAARAAATMLTARTLRALTLTEAAAP
ncbi:HTH-type transcriptional regulator Mce2R [Paraconexibacter sp. AEG42_29]|uniref:HTH-type transcriptional regulator Mce2R n=1 Tax=Paraconexibacter sp. AEG42_29 TaxID=2997339 RepID=A0AAU7ARC8_9ACTN